MIEFANCMENEMYGQDYGDQKIYMRRGLML